MIPSIELQSLLERLPEAVNLGAKRTRTVVKLDDIVVKRGKIKAARDEAELLSFIRRHTKIPVPEVLGIHDDESSWSYLFMSYVEGERLQNQWTTMTDEMKSDIQCQLNSMMLELRRLEKPPSQPLGSLHYHVCRDATRHAREGPSACESEFIEFLLSAIRQTTIKRRPALVHHVRTIFKELLGKEHGIVLTHGDLHPRNIIVRDGKVVSILDWEMGGWYPEHWEYVKALHTVDWVDDGDWVLYLPQAIGKYNDEHCRMRVLEDVVD
ncbi:hypothetical protein RUND412_001945 [Rhizina undulata]